MFPGPRQRDGVDFADHDPYGLPGAQRLYLANRVLDFLFARLPVSCCRHYRQDNFIHGSLMKLKDCNTVAAIHQMREELAVHDTAVGEEEVIAGARDLKPHQGKVIAASAL